MNLQSQRLTLEKRNSYPGLKYDPVGLALLHLSPTRPLPLSYSCSRPPRPRRAYALFTGLLSFLEILIIFERGAPTFRFALDPSSYVVNHLLSLWERKERNAARTSLCHSRGNMPSVPISDLIFHWACVERMKQEIMWMPFMYLLPTLISKTVFAFDKVVET